MGNSKAARSSSTRTPQPPTCSASSMTRKWSPSTARKPASRISSSRSPGADWHNMNWQTIPPLIKKDLMLFFRNRFYTFITIVALVAYIGVYYAMPDSVDEIIEVGLYAPSTSAEATRMLDEDGISFEVF